MADIVVVKKQQHVPTTYMVDQLPKVAKHIVAGDIVFVPGKEPDWKQFHIAVRKQGQYSFVVEGVDAYQ